MGLFSKKQTPVRRPKLSQPEYTFRRSRTLTGSTSAQVNPSVEARSQLKTPRLKEHELRQKKSRVLKILLGITICIAFLTFALVNFIGTFMFHYPQTSAATPSSHVYEKSLEEYFGSRPFERFGFSLNMQQLEQFMRQKHSEISTIMISKAWYGGDVRFNITFRKPLLVWQSGNNRFYVDDQGISFTYDHFGAALVAVEDQSGITPDAGSAVASQRFLRFLGRMVGAVNSGGRGVIASVIIPPSTREIDLKIEGREYPIKTHIDRDPLQQAEDLLNALRYMDEHQIKPTYIDVRVGGKAYYK